MNPAMLAGGACTNLDKRWGKTSPPYRIADSPVCIRTGACTAPGRLDHGGSQGRNAAAVILQDDGEKTLEQGPLARPRGG